VTVFHRGRSHHEALPEGLRHIHGDLAEWDRHLPELRALDPEVVLDMVPYREEHGQRVLGFADIARRSVVCSSMDVYRAYGRLTGTEPGDPDPVPLTEDSPLRAELSVAGLAYNKTAVERVAASDPALPCTILRLPAVHGPGDFQHRLHPYLKRMDDGRPAILLDSQLAPWRWARGYAENVGDAVALATVDERAAGRVYNVCDEPTFSEAEWVERLAAVVGWRGGIVTVPNLGINGPGELDMRQSMVVSAERIRTELGWAEQVDLDEGLRRTVVWERANPPAQTPEGEFDYEREDALLAERG
jgi:nucleoside-diphosphate-sugar epimerase